MSDKENIVNKFINKIKEDKKLQKILIIIVCLLCVLLIFLSSYSKKSEKSNLNIAEQYIENLQNRLTDVLSDVKGAGKINVIITLESGMETVVAMKTTTTKRDNVTEIVSTPVFVNGKVVVLKENYPEIKGVLIVCEGANNIIVRSKITEATISLLDINKDKIQILSMK